MGFDNWLTPPDILDRVRSVYGGLIDFDPASNLVAQQYVKATQNCVAPDDEYQPPYGVLSHDIPPGMRIDGLKQDWRGNIWCNPPYSAGNIDAFVQKGITEWNDCFRDTFANIRRGRVTQMMFLVNSSTDTEWYHTLLRNCSVALLWKGRIKFWKIENGAAHKKWEGQKSKEMGLGKIGNSPRYLSTLFYFGAFEDTFMNVFHSKGTFIKVPYRVSR